MDKPSVRRSVLRRLRISGVWPPLFPWEAEVQMAAPPRMEPIEHRATFDWLKHRVRIETKREGALAEWSCLFLRPPRWPLTECAFS